MMRHVEHVHIMALVDVHGYMCVEIKQLLKRIKVSVQLLFSQIIIFVCLCMGQSLLCYLRFVKYFMNTVVINARCIDKLT